MDFSSNVKLNDGREMPLLGLGVYLIHSNIAEEVFDKAIDLGYRLFDTASFYGNEKEVGEAVSRSSIPRKEFFVTTKLWNSDHGYKKAVNAFDRSMELLGLDYVDLYLIHWPVANLRMDSWKALESLLETERVKTIGVSNYMVHHLDELLQKSEIVPAVNQVEFHPWLYRKELRAYCKEKGIQFQAYSPLTKGQKLQNRTLKDIGDKYGKSTAQILIRWCLQHNISTIPKSGNLKHLQENMNVFDFTLTQHDMETINSLDQGHSVTWDPRDQP
jgi:diketogulonate reductase-like aldo/keto reductase